jgi:hypothetical protein
VPDTVKAGMTLDQAWAAIKAAGFIPEVIGPPCDTNVPSQHFKMCRQIGVGGSCPPNKVIKLKPFRFVRGAAVFLPRTLRSRAGRNSTGWFYRTAREIVGRPRAFNLQYH